MIDAVEHKCLKGEGISHLLSESLPEKCFLIGD